jgi:hypothetical protein
MPPTDDNRISRVDDNTPPATQDARQAIPDPVPPELSPRTGRWPRSLLVSFDTAQAQAQARREAKLEARRQAALDAEIEYWKTKLEFIDSSYCNPSLD